MLCDILNVQGFSFEGANETSLMTYGTSISTATFVDCHWDVSEMVDLVHNLYNLVMKFVCLYFPSNCLLMDMI